MKKLSKTLTCIVLSITIFTSFFAIAQAMPASTVEDVFRWDNFVNEIEFMQTTKRGELTKAEAVYLAAVFRARGFQFHTAQAAWDFISDFWDSYLDRNFISKGYAINAVRYPLEQYFVGGNGSYVSVDVYETLWDYVNEYTGNYKDQAGTSIGGGGSQGSTDPADYPGMLSPAQIIGTSWSSKYNELIELKGVVDHGGVKFVDFRVTDLDPEANGWYQEGSVTRLPANFENVTYTWYIWNGMILSYVSWYNLDTKTIEFDNNARFMDYDYGGSSGSSGSDITITIGAEVGEDMNYKKQGAYKNWALHIPMSNTGASSDFLLPPIEDGSRNYVFGDERNNLFDGLPNVSNEEADLLSRAIDSLNINKYFDDLRYKIDIKLGRIPSSLTEVFNELGTIEPARIPDLKMTLPKFWGGGEYRVVNNQYLNDDILPVTRTWAEGIFWVFYVLYVYRQILALFGRDPVGASGHSGDAPIAEHKVISATGIKIHTWE